MEKKRQPIGVFDSGAGGLSVLKELVRLMPEEDFIYYGDSLNAPYGVKPLEEVRQLTYACAEHLLERGVKEIIIACNTATSAACKIMRGMYPDLPLVGIEPAVKPAAQNHRGEKVAVMATPLTLHEEKFKQLVKRYENLATIIPVPCPDLVEYVEKGILEGPELEGYLKDVLTPCLQERELPDRQNVCWLRKISVQIKKKGTSALRAVHPKKKHIMKRCIERQRILTAE